MHISTCSFFHMRKTYRANQARVILKAENGICRIVLFVKSKVNTCITVKIVGGISLCNGGKLEESEGLNCFFIVFCVRIEIDQL